MFAGIVEGTGETTQIGLVPGGMSLRIDLGALSEVVKVGDSISVDGVCLTVAAIEQTQATFNVITETLSKTSLGRLKVGSKANLERSLRVGDRIEGHFVQGHVNGVGVVTRRVATEKEFKLWIKTPENLAIYLPLQGSVAINGVSMTIAELEADAFAIALVPTTLALTNLGLLNVDDIVNIETDILSRQIIHWLEETHAEET